jgi:uncharacterized protein YecT (DUF1311 family)
MKKTLLLLTLTLTFLFPASFDCNKAKTDVEKLICSNEELSKLDEELNEAYKKALSFIIDKKEFNQEQLKWLKQRSDCFAKCKDCMPIAECLSMKYQYRTAYLNFYARPDVFDVIYSKDNITCNWFVNLLNNDLKKYNEINLSNHEEFNRVEWRNIQKEGRHSNGFRYDIWINYFDINNDGTEEAVFKWYIDYRGWITSDITYTTKENGKHIEEYEPYKIKNNGWTSKEGEILGFALNGRESSINASDTRINDGFGGYVYTKPVSDAMHSPNSTNNFNNINYLNYLKAWGRSSFISPEPYPVKFNNQYFVAVFGALQGFNKDNPAHTMDNNGNIVALVKYDSNNEKSEVCILTRANPNTKKYFKIF